MASRKSKDPNGERGRRLMKVMMCEANRKEDRMCGKQMERRQPSGKGHNVQPLRPAQWLCLKWPETPGLSGERGARSSSLPGATSAAKTCTGRLGEMGGFLQLVAAGGHPALSHVCFFCILFGAEPERCCERGDSPVGWMGWVPGLLHLPGRLGRRMGHPATLCYGSTFPRLTFCFDKCYTSHFGLLILPACQMLQLHRKS